MDPPSGLGRAGFRSGGKAQKECGDILLRAGKREAAACDEIEDFRGPGYFDHDGAERGTSQRIGCGLDRVVRMGCADQQYLRRIDAEIDKPRGGDLSEFQGREVLANPENFFLARNTRGHTGGKSRGRGFGIGGGIDFVQRTALQTAFQGGVSRSVSQRDAGIGDKRLQAGGGKSGAKARQFFRRPSHGPSRRPA